MPLTVRCRADAPFPDTTHHTIRYVGVQTGVQLEVIDWGGTVRPVVLLHGMNATAHVFDDFAPETLERGSDGKLRYRLDFYTQAVR